MGRLETANVAGFANRERRLEQQKAMKDTQFTPKWPGKGSPDRNAVQALDASPTRQPSQNADTGHLSKSSNSSIKQREIVTLRTKAQQISSREPVLETGRPGGRIIDQNPVKGEDDAFELFKKEFIEKLAEKAKERHGYSLANEDFAKSSLKSIKQTDDDSVKTGKAHSKLNQTDEDFLKRLKASSEPKQTEEEFLKPVRAQPKLFKQTETLERPRSFVGSPNLKKDILERAARIIESSKTFLESSSLEKRKSSPRHEKLNRSLDKRAWSESKDIEETSKDFILNKFFQTPTKTTPPNSVYDVYATDEEATPRMYSSRRRILSTELNAAENTKLVGQRSLTRDGKQNQGQTTEQSERSREDQDFDSSETLESHAAQIQRDMSKPSSGSPGRIFSSADRRKDSPRSPGRNLSSEERKDSSRSPGRRISSEGRKNDSSRSPGRRLSSQERKSDSFQISKESPFETPQPELPGLQSNSGRVRNRSSENESQQESVRREKEAMLKSVKKAAAVDQAHFLRALQDNGAVQSSINIRSPSSPNGTKNSNTLREAKANSRVDERQDFLSEVRETRGREPSPMGRTELGSFRSSNRSREPSPTGRRAAALSGSSSPSREPSPMGRRDATPFGSSTRSREPSPTGRREPTSGPTNVVSQRRSQSPDSSSERGSLRSGQIQKKDSGERSQLSSGANYPPCGSPCLSRQSSSRSIGTDENESVSGRSVIEKLMRKASLRNSLSSAENRTTSSSAHSSPNHGLGPLPSSNSKADLRRTRSFEDSNRDINKTLPESPPRQTRASSPTPYATLRRSSSEVNRPEAPPQVLSERKSSPSRATSVVEESAASAPSQQHPLNNSLRVNVQVKECTIANLKSHASTSPVISDSQKLATVKTIEESCRPIATPERTLSSVTLSGSPWSPGSENSSSEASDIDQPSPVSVLHYNNNNRRTPFQEDTRLSPLEHKLQVLQERIHKSKTEVTNQKKSRLEKIKAREAELGLCVVTELNTEELLGVEVSKPPKPQATHLQLVLHVPSDVQEKKPTASVSLRVASDAPEKTLARVVAITRDENLERVRLAGPISDFSTSVETFDLKNIKPWAQDKKWDLLYIRDVLLVSNFGRDRSTMTKWHSVTEPMDPCLFEKLEEFYRLGRKFPGCQFLSSLADSREGHPRMQEYVQRVFFNPEARLRGAVDTMNRCQLFDVVNETLAKKLVPYVTLSRPWTKPLAKPVVRPRPTGSALMQEIWTDIYGQIGNNGSMSMDKAQLHQSLEDLISEDLFKRTDLFPSREVGRVSERLGIELERRILDDLIEEAISSLRKFV